MRNIYLANRVKELREEKGISIEEFCETFGIENKKLKRFEAQDYSITIRMALRMAEYFEKEIEDIFHLEQT